jgi:hypothetical protein
MAHEEELVDELANELVTWPGVSVGRRADGAAIVRYEALELGVLYPERGVAELSFWHRDRDKLVEEGDAEPAGDAPESERVTHSVEGPSDVTAVLELFDRRYRELRGDDPPYTSEDPA